MGDKYNEWINNCQEWRDKLEERLEHGGEDVVVQHSDVAFAFPSRSPHFYSFDFPRIDDKELCQWAEARGWKIQFAYEETDEEDKHTPWVRFNKA